MGKQHSKTTQCKFLHMQEEHLYFLYLAKSIKFLELDARAADPFPNSRAAELCCDCVQTDSVLFIFKDNYS